MYTVKPQRKESAKCNGITSGTPFDRHSDPTPSLTDFAYTVHEYDNAINSEQLPRRFGTYIDYI